MTFSKASLLTLITALISAVVTASAMLFFQDAHQGTGTRTSAPPSVGDFALLDQNGRFHQLYRHHNAKAVVLYTQGVGCPIVRNSMSSLKELRHHYGDKGVEFLLINANPQDDREALREEISLLGIDMPILKDDSQLVIESLNVTRTGEAILLDTATWAIRYRGPIDDRLHYESQRPKATQHYLEDAIEAVLDDDPVTVARVTGIGCVINKEHQLANKSHTISYVDEVVPILQQKCLVCHRGGGIGPWSMDSYAAVKGWASMMREVIMNKRMPPWQADPMIGEFLSDRSLNTHEQKTLIHWIDAGAPRGRGKDPLAQDPPPPAERWPLGEPDLVLDVPQQNIPAQGILPYNWIKIPVPINKDTWVRAVDLKPSNPSVMHHGFVFVKYPERLKSEEPAWLEGLNGFFAAYVPGVNVLPFPKDSGQLLPAGATLLFQLHYVPVGYPTTDQPSLALYFHQKPPEMEYKMASAVNMQIRIPPYAADHEEKAVKTIEEEGILHGFYPHMHYRGSRFQYHAQYPDGSQETLLSVPNYNINWQTFYRLERPKRLPAGTRIVINAAFDNSEQNPVNPDPSKEVRWGLKSRDEMLVGYFMYTRKRDISDAL